MRTWQTHSQGQLLHAIEVGLSNHMASCTALVKDATEQRIAVGMSDGILCIWNLVTQSPPAFSFQFQQVRCLAARSQADSMLQSP